MLSTIQLKGVFKIPLEKGIFALIDDEDFELVSQHNWVYLGKYAMTGISGKPVGMHKLLMGVHQGMVIDHKNNNPLDNRRENLRLCTFSQNSKNMISRIGISGFRGVVKHHSTDKWEAKLDHQTKRISIGLFDNPRHAALARDLWAHDLDGEYAKMNFPIVS